MKLPKKPWSERRAEPAVPDDLGRHALVDLAVAARAEEEREVGMGVHVDEAGADDAAPRVDPLSRRRCAEVADRRDAPLPDADVGPVGAGAGAVHHESAGQRAIDDPRLPVSVAGYPADFVATDHLDAKEARRTDPFAQYAIATAS